MRHLEELELVLNRTKTQVTASHGVLQRAVAEKLGAPVGVDRVKYLGVQRHNGKTRRVGLLKARSSLAGARLRRLRWGRGYASTRRRRAGA
eukprot:6210041-Amphidinium_carterae.1